MNKQSTMNSPIKSHDAVYQQINNDTSSPTGVIDTWEHLNGIPAIPDILQEPQKQVRFSGSKIAIEPDWTLNDLHNVWWSKEEIASFQLEGKKSAKDFRKEFKLQIEVLGKLLEDCKNESNVNRVLSSPTAQEFLRLFPIRISVRGLENRLHKRIGQYRLFHVKSLLAVQHSMKMKDRTPESLERLLRVSGRHTSRALQALARLSAQGDQLYVTAMIRQELALPIVII